MKTCSVSGCIRKVEAKGLCNSHYSVKRGKEREKENKVNGLICKVKGCNRGVRSSGLCNNHYSMRFLEKWKEQIFEHLGEKKCVICGFSDERALCFDHVFNDGYMDRKKYSTTSRYWWKKYADNQDLARERLQVLCFNCNQIKEINRKNAIS